MRSFHRPAARRGTSYNALTRTLAYRYNDQGPQGLGDRRHGNPGSTCILSQEQQAQLYQTLDEPAADGGLWTGPKVVRWIESQTGRQVHLLF